MKRSDKLIIGLLLITLLFGLCSNLVLKSEFEKIDRKDPFWGYKQITVEKFKYVKLQGLSSGFVQIQPGPVYGYKTVGDSTFMSSRIDHDTLIISMTGKGNGSRVFGENPSVYVTAPTLSGVMSNDILCKIKNWKLNNLEISQQGNTITISNNFIDSLTVKLGSLGNMTIENDNKIRNSSISVKGGSKFTTDNVYTKFEMTVDSTSRIDIPGILLDGVLKN